MFSFLRPSSSSSSRRFLRRNRIDACSAASSPSSPSLLSSSSSSTLALPTHEIPDASGRSFGGGWDHDEHDGDDHDDYQQQQQQQQQQQRRRRRGNGHAEQTTNHPKRTTRGTSRFLSTSPFAAATSASTTSTMCTSFLLGGSYYPGKDKGRHRGGRRVVGVGGGTSFCGVLFVAIFLVACACYVAYGIAVVLVFGGKTGSGSGGGGGGGGGVDGSEGVNGGGKGVIGGGKGAESKSLSPLLTDTFPDLAGVVRTYEEYVSDAHHLRREVEEARAIEEKEAMNEIKREYEARHERRRRKRAGGGGGSKKIRLKSRHHYRMEELLARIDEGIKYFVGRNNPLSENDEGESEDESESESEIESERKSANDMETNRDEKTHKTNHASMMHQQDDERKQSKKNGRSAEGKQEPLHKVDGMNKEHRQKEQVDMDMNKDGNKDGNMDILGDNIVPPDQKDFDEIARMVLEGNVDVGQDENDDEDGAGEETQPKLDEQQQQHQEQEQDVGKGSQGTDAGITAAEDDKVVVVEAFGRNAKDDTLQMIDNAESKKVSTSTSTIITKSMIEIGEEEGKKVRDKRIENNDKNAVGITTKPMEAQDDEKESNNDRRKKRGKAKTDVAGNGDKGKKKKKNDIDDGKTTNNGNDNDTEKKNEKDGKIHAGNDKNNYDNDNNDVTKPKPIPKREPATMAVQQILQHDTNDAPFATSTNNSSCPLDLSPTSISVTLVTQTTLDRAFLLPLVCERWGKDNPMVAVVFLSHPMMNHHHHHQGMTHGNHNNDDNNNDNEDENDDGRVWETRWRKQIQDSCPNLTLVPYKGTRDESRLGMYPVNKLRNAGLDRVKTSHVLVLDADFVPSVDLHHTIESVLLLLLNSSSKKKTKMTTTNERDALVVPVFDRRPPSGVLRCLDAGGCSRYIKDDPAFLPSTLDELRSCVASPLVEDDGDEDDATATNRGEGGGIDKGEAGKKKKKKKNEKKCIVFQSDVNWDGHYTTRSMEWLEGRWYDDEFNDYDDDDGYDIKGEEDEGKGKEGVVWRDGKNVSESAAGSSGKDRHWIDPDRPIRKIKCFDSPRYEPWTVVRWCPSSSSAAAVDKDFGGGGGGGGQEVVGGTGETIALPALPPSRPRPVAPYFDERFHGYGKNKIQWVSHLRFMGYAFRVLPRAFAVHHPHPESRHKEVWNDRRGGGGGGGGADVDRNLHAEMDALYPKFVKELIRKYDGGRHALPGCEDERWDRRKRRGKKKKEEDRPDKKKDDENGRVG